MQLGVVGSFCFLAFLLSSEIKCEDLLNAQDLQQGGPNELLIADSELNNEDLNPEDRSARAIAHSGLNQANAEAYASAESGANSYLRGANSPKFAYPSPLYGSAAAGANALAQTTSAGNFGSSHSQADAQANAQSNYIGGSPLGVRFRPQYSPFGSVSSAQGQASANSNSNYLSNHGNSEAYAQAESAANSYSQGVYGPQSGYPSSGYGSASAEANAFAQSASGGMFGSNNAQTEAIANSQSNYQSGIPSSAGYQRPYSAYIPSSGSSNAQAQALSNAFGGGYGLNDLLSQSNSAAHAQAEASANSNSQGLYAPHLGYPSSGYGSASAEANAHAQTASDGISGSNSQAEALANSQSNYQGGIPLSFGYQRPYSTYIPSSGFLGSNNAQAMALSNAVGGGYGLDDLTSQTNAEAHAQAESSANSYLQGLYGPQLGYPSSGYSSASAEANALAQSSSGGMLGSSNAQAEALANSQSSYQGGIPLGLGYQRPYPTYISSSGLSNAQAQAMSNVFGGGYGLDYLPSQANSAAHSQAESSANSYSQGLYGPQLGYPSSSYGSSSAEANALAQSASGGLAGSSNAQAEALANSHSNYQGGIPLSIGFQRPYSTYIPSSGSSNAQAQAMSNAIGGGYGLDYLPSQANSAAHAQAESSANSYSQGLYGPQSSGYGSSSAEANAFSQTAFGGMSGSSNAHAEAVSQAQGGGNSLLLNDNLAPFLYPTGSSSHAEANAQSFGGANVNPRFIRQGYSSQEALAQALARAKSQSQTPSYHGYPIRGSSSAEANALAQSFGNLGLGPRYNNQGLSSTEAQAQSQSQTKSQGQGLTQSQSQSQAQAQTQSHGHGQRNLQSQTQAHGQSQSIAPGMSQSQAHAHSEVNAIGLSPAQAKNIASANAQSAAKSQALADARSRAIPSHEYVHPHALPGGDSIVQCTREGELHNFWSSAYNCLVCACINQNGYLRPVCASCAGCMAPPLVPAIVPILRPETRESCHPLPTETPFENPLNPCQICVCHAIVDPFGRQDVKIMCQENSHCSVPDVIVPIPPKTLPPKLIPMPLCQNFPTNVPIPHPHDACSICECLISSTSSNVPQHEMICYPKPECEEIPESPLVLEPLPLPEDIPVLPQLLEPIPIPLPEPEYLPAPLPQPEPVIPIEILEPEFVPVPPPMPEPIPIPIIEPEIYPTPSELEPIPVPLPEQVPQHLRPGPLPGPSPHKSCRPYRPNQPFAHPWDECQECVCTESYEQGVINVEVNCYTNRACCVELASPQQLPYLNPGHPLLPSNLNLKVLDSVCENRGLGLEFLNPRDLCRLCTCERLGNFVVPVCSRVNRLECLASPDTPPYADIVYLEPQCRHRIPMQPFVTGCSVCTCQLVFNYVIAKCNRQPNCGAGSLYPGGSADAYANAQTNALSHYSSLPPLYPFTSLPGGSAHSAEAVASANSNVQVLELSPYQAGSPYLTSSGQTAAEAQAHAQANSDGYGPNSYGLATSDAEAIANSAYSQYRPIGLPIVLPLETESAGNAYYGYNQLVPSYQSGSSASAVANSLSNENLGFNTLQPQLYPNLNPTYQTLPSGDAGVRINTNSGYNSLLPGYSQNSGSSASAEAESFSGANFGLFSPNPYLNQQTVYPVSSGSTNAEAISSTNSEYNSMLPGSVYPFLDSALSLTNADAFSGAGLNPTLYINQPYPSFGPQISALSEAEAVANAGLISNSGLDSSSLTLANAKAISDSAEPFHYQPNIGTPYGLTSSSADAEAVANANSGYGSGHHSSSASAIADAHSNSIINSGLYQNLQSLRPGYQAGSSALTEAQGPANPNVGYNHFFPGQSYPYSPVGLTSAEAEAFANTNSVYNPYLNSYQAGSVSSAEAEAIANANTRYSNPGLFTAGIMPGSSSNSYANALSESSSNVNSFGSYSPYGQHPSHAGSSYSNADAEAEAHSSSNSITGARGPSQAIAQSVSSSYGQGQSSAHSHAQASAISGLPLIKSGKTEDVSTEDLA